MSGKSKTDTIIYLANKLANQRDEYYRQLKECQSKSGSNAYIQKPTQVSLPNNQKSNAYSQKPIPIQVSLANKQTKYNNQVIERSFANPASNSMSRTNLYNPQRWNSKGGKTRRRNKKNKNKSRRNRK